MNASLRFALVSLLLVILCIGGLVGFTQYITQNGFPTDIQSLNFYIISAIGAVVLWLLLQFAGRGLAQQVRASLPTPPAESAVVTQPKPEPKPAPPPVKAEPQVDIAKVTEAGALQMLAILQRKGRLIDFLQEDLTPFSDDQVGAAARTVHSGCKEALSESLNLEPIFTEAEGDTVTVDAGFDAHSIRLSGNVSGEPPFSGALRHRGWRAQAVNLPQRTSGTGGEEIIAAAEIEI
ncbi:MAG: DUF2760 domain-containing protein [Chloroflexota bacterium]